MGIRKLLTASSRSTGNYAPVNTEKNPEDTSPIFKSQQSFEKTEKMSPETPPTTQPEPEILPEITVEEFSSAFLKKAQLEFKKKVAVDDQLNDEGVTKPAFCGTTEKRRRKREALAILYRHLERDIMILKRRQNSTVDLNELTEAGKFDRFFIQLAIDIFNVYEYQLRHYLKGQSNSKTGKTLQSVAEFTARMCFGKFCERKLKNLSKDEILYETLTHFDSTTTALMRRESRRPSENESSDKVKTEVKPVEKETVEVEPEKEKTEKDDKPSKKEKKVEKVKPEKNKLERSKNHRSSRRGSCDRSASLKFFEEAIPAFYCVSSGSLLVQSKNLKRLLKGKTEPNDIALRIRRPFKIEWDQMQRGREGDLKTIDHLIDGSEEDIKKFMWTDKTRIVDQIYVAWEEENGKKEEETQDCDGRQEKEEDEDLKEAFSKLDKDIDKTQDVIREMEEKLR